MGVVTERLVRRTTAATQFDVLGACHRTAGSAAYFHRASYFQWTVFDGNDMQFAATFLQRFGSDTNGFTACREVNIPVAVVTKWLVFRLSATAQGGPVHAALLIDIE